jgi:hypothetical protein
MNMLYRVLTATALMADPNRLLNHPSFVAQRQDALSSEGQTEDEISGGAMLL